MRTTAMLPLQRRAHAVDCSTASLSPQDPSIRVFMMDLLSIVPYYTGHLCASLVNNNSLQLTLGSITYQHDRGFFQRKGVRNNLGLFDVASRCRIGSALARRALKIVESLINMTALLLRFALSKPDVIHVQFIPLVRYGLPFEIWFLKFMRALNIRLVYTVHNVLPQDTGERYSSTFRRIYHLVDRLICHDKPASDRLISEFGVSPERISIIPHGPLFAEASQVTPQQARAKLGLAVDECLVLWQGILRPYKGVPFLLNAWKRVCETGTNARLIIVGTGDATLVADLERLIVSLGIAPSVRCELRFVSVDELSDFYHAADIVVYPYSEVTTSGTLMTGVAYGKSVVATALPAFEQILRHDDNALVVPYGDVDQLAATLTRLVADSKLRNRLGRRLREDFSNSPQWPEIAQQTAECYRAALSLTVSQIATETSSICKPA
jgi:glycosyltransferase involved in cell wall biosynthesis